MALKYTALALAAFVLATPAFAQLKQGFGQALTEKETEAAILGIDMQGYSPSERFSWRECIQPNGETLYETPAGVLKGKVLVSPRGEACFSYEDSDYAAVNCFATFRTQDGLRFEGAGGSLFLTTKVIRNVKTCNPQDLVG
jgi:hypothetical protein